ncbi:MFS transporter [Subtercola lobariae]|uniref:MFS transporter n=1 Tax=Subtercola lobariae TaxID=1588641 RepID=A0A917BAS3_9MICO|nr:MFS transporter [Subtercola lobariae]GGF34842.1 MFS transporter [Subtercola lobariae]
MTNPVTPDLAAAGATISPHAAPPGGWPNPRNGFLFFLGAAAIGAGIAELVPVVLTLSVKATLIDKANAVTILSLAIGLGAVVALITFPLFGRLSDRITWRTGRRRPLLIVGAVLIAIGALLTFAANSVGLLVLSNVFTQVGFAAAIVGVTSVIPDQFEPLKRGPASAIVGLALPIGAVVGLFIAQLFSPNLAGMILVPAAVGIVGVLLFAIVLKDRPFPRELRPPFTAVAFFSTFWVNPIKHPSFAWAWWSRLLLFLGVGSVQGYQALYLIFALHFDAVSVARAVFISTLTLTVAALIFGGITGKVSDKIGRRKPFVMAAAVVFAIGLVTAANATSYPSFLVAIAIVGAGQGIYLAVDLALVSQILPDPTNPAKDMGVITLTSTLASSLVPAIAPAILTIGATSTVTHNYSALFLSGAVAAIVGALFIIPIRGVK